MATKTATTKKTTTTKATPRVSGGMEATVYGNTGKAAGKVSLPASVFGAKWNADLVHQVVLAMQANARAGTAHTKDRSEVRGGGKKPWKQKGTGRARHGSRRSPIWTGGGVTFGPRSEKDYSQKINKNARIKALASVLSRKYADGEVLFVDASTLGAPKTKEAQALFVALSEVQGHEMLKSKKENAVLVLTAERDENVEKSFRNFGNVTVVQAKDVNPVDVLTFARVVVLTPEQSVEVLKRRVALKQERTKVAA